MATGQRLFIDAFRDMQRAVKTYQDANYPPTDVIEHHDNFTLEAELPGYTKKNIKINMVDTHTLVLSGSIDDDDYEAHHPKKSNYVICEAHGESVGPICKRCEAGLKKTEEDQERDSQAVKVEQAQAAEVQNAQKREEAQQADKSTDVQASKSTDTQKSVVEKAKDAFSTQAKKLETKAKKVEAGQAHKAEEAQAKKVKEARVTKTQDKKGEQARESQKENSRQRISQYLIKERNQADSFSRVYTFPNYIQTEGIKARFEDGILKAIIPKINVEEHQRINID